MQEKVALASNTYELIELYYTLRKINPNIQQQILHAIQKEQRSDEIVISLLKQHEFDEQKIKTITGNLNLFNLIIDNILSREQTLRLQQENSRLRQSKLELSMKNSELQDKLDCESDSLFSNPEAYLLISGGAALGICATYVLMKK